VAHDALTAVYHGYLQCLNERRWDDLGEFVCEDVSHNDNRFGLAGYRAMLEADVRAIPDLRFTADLVVAAEDLLACRLVFRCTPRLPFLGFAPTGAPITFAEHVFYRFRDDRIAEVSSLIDTRAIEAQTAG
jgi:predicted ester cyclase